MAIIKRTLTTLLILSALLRAGVEHRGRGAQSTGLADAFVAIADNPWTIYHNPAGLSRLKQYSVSVCFVPQQFGLAELSSKSLAAVLPLDFGTIGAGVEQFGFDLYKETILSAGFGQRFDRGISAGVTLHIQHLSLDRYGTSQNVIVDIGLLAEADPTLRLGFAFRNVSGTTIGIARERLPQSLIVGVQYSPLIDFQLSVELEKDPRFPTIVKFGIEQRFFETVSMRLGASNNPDTFSFGLSVKSSPLEVGYAGYTHPQLGITHLFEIAVVFGE